MFQFLCLIVASLTPHAKKLFTKLQFSTMTNSDNLTGTGSSRK